MRVETIGDCTLYLGDCREVLPGKIKSTAIITDPPYHGVKADHWDNQWSDDASFIEWVGAVSELLHHCTMPNSSLFWFASPRMAARVEIALSERFRVLNNIVWDKSGSRKGAGGSGVDVTALRSFWSANTERLIFADRPEADAAASLVFSSYLRAEMARAGLTNRTVQELFPSKSGGLTGCVSNWLLGLNVPTREQYEAIRVRANVGGGNFLAVPYDNLWAQYEATRRPFLATTMREWGDVWRFPLERSPEHPTQKPINLMAHIVEVSSHPTQTILDPFMGSGTTGVACALTDRCFIGVEREPSYFDIACRRIEAAYKQPRLFAEPVIRPKQESLL